MKKILTLALGACVAFSASAQSWQDALLFSENEYGGTARSIGMANAFTAVGGDLGSIGINPAGSAVAGYSTIALSAGLSFSVANAVSENRDLAFGDNVTTNFTRFKMPSVGFVIGMNTGNRTGLKRVTLGFLSNSTADYTGRMYASGINGTNSYSGSLASRAQGYPQDALALALGYNWFNLDDLKDASGNRPAYGLPWEDVAAYRSGVIGMVGGQYLGLTDYAKGSGLTGPLASLWQKYGFQTKGFKHDMVVNLGLDFSDTFYLGANVGISLLSYGQGEYWYEAPADPSDPAWIIPFDENPNARFQYLEGKRIFDVKGSGVYFKVGALWRPVAGLRLGAAIQTPTWLHMETRMAVYGKAAMNGVRLDAESSPDWLDSYTLRSPWRFNAGAAYSFGSIALLSVDWEVANYGRCRFRKTDEDSRIYGQPNFILEENEAISGTLGTSHMLRAGLEVNVTPAFALRAGYAFTTSGEKGFITGWEYDSALGRYHPVCASLTSQERASLLKQQFSVGFGYKWSAFFADFAFRYRTTPTQYTIPYQYYDYDASAGTYAYQDKWVSDEPTYQLPEVITVYKRFDATLTLGLRF